MMVILGFENDPFDILENILSKYMIHKITSM